MLWTRDDFWLAGISETGSKHKDVGKPCEDAHFIGRSGQSFVLVACDGAGAKKFSKTGARVVSGVVGRLLLEYADEFIARRMGGDTVISAARFALEKKMETKGGEIGDYGCTLVALLVHKGELLTCHVGDGAIFILEGEHPRMLSPPEGEGRATYFVTTEGVRPRMWGRKLEHHMLGFLVVSDGADALANRITGEVSQVVTRFVNQLDLAPERKAAGLLRSTCLDTVSPRTDDDITLVAARRAFASGKYGCPECFGPKLLTGYVKRVGQYVGLCDWCGHIVFRAKTPNRIRGYELIRDEPRSRNKTRQAASRRRSSLKTPSKARGY